MLITKRRTYKRFDGTLFIEFRPLSGTASFSLGLTRNFSWEGFSFEYQNFSLEMGENLEFKIKQPRTNQFIGFHGVVIWKQQSEIKYVAGIQFTNMDLAFKQRMMEMISESCHISEESWRLSEHKGSRRIKMRDKNKSQLDQTEEISNIPEVPDDGNKQKPIVKMALIAAAGMMVFLIPRLLDNSRENILEQVSESFQSAVHTVDNNPSLPDQRDKITEEGSDTSGPLPPADHEKTKELAEGEAIPLGQDNAEDLKASSSDANITGTAGYHVQVASFKDPDTAFHTFLKIAEDYPEAYLFRQGNFYKIRISNIAAYSQGVILLRDIEEKFKLKSLLVSKTE